MRFSAAGLRVLHRDRQYLALEKPPGIATTAPDGGVSLFTLAAELDPEAEQLHPLSRLDTQVSGLVVFARTAAANERVLRARREGGLHRRYLGLCAVAPSATQGDWRWAIGIDPRDPRHRRALAPDAAGAGTKLAHTRYALRANSGPVFALDLFPQTGRTHQLRVHAAAAGVPLLGDAAYGGARRLTLANGRILSAERVMLHCAEVCLPQLGADELLRLVLAPPPDMARLWQSAGGDPAGLA